MGLLPICHLSLVTCHSIDRHVDVVALNLEGIAFDRGARRPGEDTAVADVEAGAVAGALDGVALEVALVERAAVMGADVLDGVELAVYVGDGEALAADAHHLERA